MDQCIIDITHIPHVRVGDEVVLIGQQGTASLTAEQVAQRLGTINYEVVSEISLVAASRLRFPRSSKIDRRKRRCNWTK